MKGKRLLLAVVLLLSLMGILVAFSAILNTELVRGMPDNAITWVPICLDADRARTSPWDKLCPPAYPRLSSQPADGTNRAEVAYVPICLDDAYRGPGSLTGKVCPPYYPFPLE